LYNRIRVCLEVRATTAGRGIACHGEAVAVIRAEASTLLPHHNHLCHLCGGLFTENTGPSIHGSGVRSIERIESLGALSQSQIRGIKYCCRHLFLVEPEEKGLANQAEQDSPLYSEEGIVSVAAWEHSHSGIQAE